MRPKRRPQSLSAQTQEPPRTVNSPYLTSEQAIVYLRLDGLNSPKSALYRLIAEHRLPHGRRGKLYLFDARELDAWVKGFPSALEMVRSKRSA
jgi:excisionase family DNA binding protein